MAFFLLSPLLLVTAEWHALRALLRTLHHWKVALLLSFISGPPNSRLTQALESDENDWNTLVSFATHLGDQWVETTTVWQSGYQTGVVAQWTSQLGGDEENGWEKSRRTFQRELQRNPKDNFAWGIQQSLVECAWSVPEKVRTQRMRTQRDSIYVVKRSGNPEVRTQWDSVFVVKWP